MEAQQSSITAEVLAQCLPYEGYLELVHQAVTQNKTMGLEQDPFLARQTALYLPVMERLYQQPVHQDLVELVQVLPKPQVWFVLAEGWSGDVAVHLPVLAAIAKHSLHVDLRIALRSEQPAIMDAYLTEGSRSIPKLIALQADTLKPLGSWGPRPQVLQGYALELQAQSTPQDEFIQKVMDRSLEDNGQALQHELLHLLPHWIRTSLM